MLSNLPASSFSRQPSKPTSSLPPKSRSEFDDARPAPENPRSIVLFKLLRDSNLSPIGDDLSSLAGPFW